MNAPALVCVPSNYSRTIKTSSYARRQTQNLHTAYMGSFPPF